MHSVFKMNEYNQKYKTIPTSAEFYTTIFAIFRMIDRRSKYFAPPFFRMKAVAWCFYLQANNYKLPHSGGLHRVGRVGSWRRRKSLKTTVMTFCFARKKTISYLPYVSVAKWHIGHIIYALSMGQMTEGRKQYVIIWKIKASL